MTIKEFKDIVNKIDVPGNSSFEILSRNDEEPFELTDIVVKKSVVNTNIKVQIIVE